MGGCTAHLHQLHFQGFNDDGTNEADQTSIAAVDTNFSIAVDTVFGMRLEIEESNNCSSMNNQFHLQHNLNGTGWVTTTTSSTIAQLAASGVVADTTATTNRISGSSLGFVAGEADSDGSTSNLTLQNQHTEMLFFVKILGVHVNDQDLVQFKAISGVADLDEYHATPTVTALESGQQFQQSLSASAVASSAMVRKTSIHPFLATAAAGATLTASPLFMQSLASSALASATVTTAITFGQTLSATATATASFVKKVGKAVSASASATAALVKRTGHSLLASVVATPSLSTAATFRQTVASSALATGTLDSVFIPQGSEAPFLSKVPIIYARIRSAIKQSLPQKYSFRR